MIWLAAFLALAVVLLAYGLFEAGWLRCRVLEVEIDGLPERLDGFRIAHLSDFHLGPPSRGRIATERAVAWVAGRRPDLVCVTGDLVSHPRGVPLLVQLLGSLEQTVRDARKPRRRLHPRPVLARRGARRPARRRTAASRRCRRRRACRGADPARRGGRRELSEGCGATVGARRSTTSRLRILLCHFPGIECRLPTGAFHLVLAGHLHAGQITVPYPGGKLTLAHPRARFVAGVYPAAGGVLHVSPGTGTTFLPIRFFARPEVTELILRSPGSVVQQSS